MCDGEAIWPPVPSEYLFDFLDEYLIRELTDQSGAHFEEIYGDQYTFLIPVHREGDLIRVIRAAGHEIRRDDIVTEALGGVG